MASSNKANTGASMSLYNYHRGITAIIRSLGGGGAERVLTSMVNYWAQANIPTTVVTTTPKESHVFKLHPNVKTVTIPAVDNSCYLDDCPWDVEKLRDAIISARNNTVISFMEKSNVATILASTDLPIKVIISERTDPRMQTLYSSYKKSLIQRLYPLADALVVQTQSVEKGWAAQFMPSGKTHIIRNPVTLDTTSTPPVDLPEKFICCMGRLTECKGFQGLIDVLPTIFKKHREHHLVILGEGPDRAALEKQISALGLSEKVHLPGFIAAPHPMIKKADIFILPSLFEGFPNALIEAMAIGLPVVSFNCPSGPSEIISHGKNGILVDPQDYRKLASEVCQILSNPLKSRQLALSAQRYTQANCKTELVLAQWNKLVSNLHAQTNIGRKSQHLIPHMAKMQ